MKWTNGLTDSAFNMFCYAGILVGMPHGFFAERMRAELGKELGPLHSYGTGLVFAPQNDHSVQFLKDLFESQVLQQGFHVIGWRKLQTGASNVFWLKTM